DAIVREVFARLAATAVTPSETKAASDELVLTARVVSLGELEDRLNGARRVIVPKGAVITPAARDLLTSQRINVSYATRESSGFGHGLLVGLAERGFEAAA